LPTGSFGGIGTGASDGGVEAVAARGVDGSGGDPAQRAVEVGDGTSAGVDDGERAGGDDGPSGLAGGGGEVGAAGIAGGVV
jgi:hypothetical protein